METMQSALEKAQYNAEYERQWGLKNACPPHIGVDEWDFFRKGIASWTEGQ